MTTDIKIAKHFKSTDSYEGAAQKGLVNSVPLTEVAYTKDETYTKTEVDTKVSAKQDALSTAQTNAVNSGITSTKVSTYDGYASTIAGKQSSLSTAQLNACNSGITSDKVSTYDGYASTIAGKSTVTVTQTLTEGTEVARIMVDGTTYIIYAPSYTNGDEVSY